MFNFLRKKNSDIKLFYHTDVHCHLLPGVDHGAGDLETSIALMQRQADMGITRVIATSHVTECIAENSPETLLPAGELLRAEIKRQELPIDLHVSAEYRVDDLFLQQVADGKLLQFPNNYLLIENSFQQERLDLDDIIFGLQSSGYTIIMAHPERYRYYNHERFRQLHERNVLFQVNLLSLTGYFGGAALDTAKWMLHNGLIDFLGSDMHCENHAYVIEQYLRTKEYKTLASRLDGRLLNDTAFL